MAAADFQCRPDAPRAARRRAKLGSALAADCVGEAAAAGASAVFVSATGAVAGGAGLCGVRSAAGSGFGTAVSAARPAASGLAAGTGTGSGGRSYVVLGATAGGRVALGVGVSRGTSCGVCDDSSEGAATPCPR